MYFQYKVWYVIPFLITVLIQKGLVCIFYTSIGGLKAVVWTDTIQVIISYNVIDDIN